MKKMKRFNAAATAVCAAVLIFAAGCGTTSVAADSTAQKTQSAEPQKERQKAEEKTNAPKWSVQVINQEASNLPNSESVWLPGQVQDKIKSNLQEYLGMKTVVDSKAEAELKKLQAESENSGRDESAAIELGKITTAKYALFTKIRKTANGYTLSADFTDLTTGEQKASATSDEYSKPEYLYGPAGAADKLAVSLADKLGIQISDLNRKRLSSGSAAFSASEELALIQQNEANYKKMMAEYDAELAKLMTTHDVAAVQNKNRIEAEKAMLLEKQNSEKKRQEELKAQKEREEADAKLEAERSIQLKTMRDELAKQAEKAAQVRKVKMEQQSVFGQIGVIEAKKKALLEIRQSVESRSQELHERLVKDRENEIEKIKNKPYSNIELSDGKPTWQALQRRENQAVKSYEDLTDKFFADCESVRQASQQDALLAEIRADQKALAATRTVSSMGEEFKVSFSGWKVFFSLYVDGVLLYAGNFSLEYEALSGKKKPNMSAELNDAVIQEYSDNVDMYSSLLARGVPIVYFEIDYTVTPQADDKPSAYDFNFNEIRVINTASGKTVQTISLNKKNKNQVEQLKTTKIMTPAYDLREKGGIVAREKAWRNVLKNYGDKFFIIENFVMIPNKNILMLKTEVTNKLYNEIMGKEISPLYYNEVLGISSNNSNNSGNDDYNNSPVTNISWYDAIEFCRRLSIAKNLTPVKYRDNGVDIKSGNGFRLPTVNEWQFAAKGGAEYRYAGSDNIDEVAWYKGNSGKKVHPVAQKKPNGYGLYDMSGNVAEWCLDIAPGWEQNDSVGAWHYHYICGGSWNRDKNSSTVRAKMDPNPNIVVSMLWPYIINMRKGYKDVGFRVVLSVTEK